MSEVNDGQNVSVVRRRGEGSGMKRHGDGREKEREGKWRM